VPTQTLTNNDRVVPSGVHETSPAPADDVLRGIAVKHLEHVRRFKLYLTAYILSMLVLTPVWVITQYESSPGWLEHLSSRSRYPGDWDPWLIWVALIGAFVVAIAGYRAFFDRPATEADIEQEIERLKRR
jgi:hypothetical protein